MRNQLAEGIGDYVPVFLSEIPLLFSRRILPIDVALIQVSPPDAHGYCSLGPSVDVSLAAIRSAKYVITQVKPHVPRTHGDGLIPASMIHAAVEVDESIYEVPPAPIGDTDRKIGQYVASLVEDGATLQLGIGGIPNATLAELIHHKGLGIHTEMFSDGVIDLVERGVVTGEHKVVLPSRIEFCDGQPASVRFYRRQSGRNHEASQLHERHRHYSTKPQSDGHKQCYRG